MPKMRVTPGLLTRNYEAILRNLKTKESFDRHFKEYFESSASKRMASADKIKIIFTKIAFLLHANEKQIDGYKDQDITNSQIQILLSDAEKICNDNKFKNIDNYINEINRLKNYEAIEKENVEQMILGSNKDFPLNLDDMPLYSKIIAETKSKLDTTDSLPRLANTLLDLYRKSAEPKLQRFFLNQAKKIKLKSDKSNSLMAEINLHLARNIQNHSNIEVIDKETIIEMFSLAKKVGSVSVKAFAAIHLACLGKDSDENFKIFFDYAKQKNYQGHLDSISLFLHDQAIHDAMFAYIVKMKNEEKMLEDIYALRNNNSLLSQWMTSPLNKKADVDLFINLVTPYNSNNQFTNDKNSSDLSEDDTKALSPMKFSALTKKDSRAYAARGEPFFDIYQNLLKKSNWSDDYKDRYDITHIAEEKRWVMTSADPKKNPTIVADREGVKSHLPSDESDQKRHLETLLSLQLTALGGKEVQGFVIEISDPIALEKVEKSLAQIMLDKGNGLGLMTINGKSITHILTGLDIAAEKSDKKIDHNQPKSSSSPIEAEKNLNMPKNEAKKDAPKFSSQSEEVSEKEHLRIKR